jgi:hypothetical protein
MGQVISGGSNLQLWTYIKTVTNSATASIDCDSLPAYEEYMAIGYVNLGSGADNLSLRINGDATATYNSTYVAGGAIFAQAAQTSIVISEISATLKCMFRVYVTGKTPTVASGKVGINSTSASSSQAVVGGAWTGGSNVQVARLYFFSTATFTGKIEVYGRNTV